MPDATGLAGTGPTTDVRVTLGVKRIQTAAGHMKHHIMSQQDTALSEAVCLCRRNFYFETTDEDARNTWCAALSAELAESSTPPARCTSVPTSTV